MKLPIIVIALVQNGLSYPSLVVICLRQCFNFMLTSNKFKVFLVLQPKNFESPDFSHFKTVILRDSRSRLVVQDRDETLKIVSRDPRLVSKTLSLLPTRARLMLKHIGLLVVVYFFFPQSNAQKTNPYIRKETRSIE